MAQYLINSPSQLKEAVAELCKHEKLSHDTETKGPDDQPDISGLFPFHGSRSFAHIIATEFDEYYFDFNFFKGGMPDKYKKELQPIFDDPQRVIYYVNAIFDNCISHFDGLVNKCRIIDVPSMARIEYNRHGKQEWADESFLSMEYLANYYEVTKKDERVKLYVQEHNLYSEKACRFTSEKIPRYDLVPTSLMFEYGCGDARTTFELGQKVIKCINHKDKIFEVARGDAGLMIDVARTELKLTSALIDMKIEGMEIDRPYIESQIEIESANLKTLTSEVKALTGDINLNSGVQLAEYLVSKGVVPPRKQVTETALKRSKAWKDKAEALKAKGNTKGYNEAITKAIEYTKGNYSTDKKTLAKLMEKHPDIDFLSKVTKAKETEKKINTYYKNFLLIADPQGFIHANLNQEKAVTGRFSSSFPNLQNLHKDDKSVKRSFRNTDPDFDWFYIDFKQQEMIVMLDQAEEMKVIYKLIDKVFDDFYLATKSVLMDVAGVSITRQQAKAIALGLAYGEGITALSKKLGMTMEDGKAFIDTFFGALPELKKLKERLERQAKARGKIHNPFGRVSYISYDRVYTALNAFVQGMSADITKRAMVSIHAFLIPFKSKLLFSIHDELIFKIHKSERHLIPDIQRLMSEAYPHKHIALDSDVMWSPNNTSWGDKVDYIPEEHLNAA